jgi:hypothetical protein
MMNQKNQTCHSQIQGSDEQIDQRKIAIFKIDFIWIWEIGRLKNGCATVERIKQ